VKTTWGSRDELLLQQKSYEKFDFEPDGNLWDGFSLCGHRSCRSHDRPQRRYRPYGRELSWELL
jgi:hypothetical protein